MGIFRRIIILILVLCTVFLSGTVCLAGGTSTDIHDPIQGTGRTGYGNPVVSCGTFEELYNQFKKDEGGTVVLIRDIIWDNKEESDWINIEHPTTVDFNGHSLTLTEDSTMYISGPVLLTGNVVKGRALIKQETNSDLCMIDNAEIRANGENCIAIFRQKDTYTDVPKITATGEEAIGIFTEGNCDERADIGIITVIGKNAAGTFSENDIAIRDADIRAYGPGSSAIHSGGNVFAAWTRLEAEGTLVVARGDIFFDCMERGVSQESAVILHRTPVISEFEELEMAVAVGEQANLPENMSFSLCLDEEDKIYNDRYPENIWDEETADLDVIWDTKKMDTGTPGIYEITARVKDSGTPQGVSNTSLTGSVWVIDYFSKISQSYYKEFSLNIEFTENLPEYDKINVWYTLDKEKVWRNFANEGKISPIDSNTLQLKDFWIPGIREYESCRMRIEFFCGDHVKSTQNITVDNAQNVGGDRDGGDQGDQGALPKIEGNGNGASHKTKNKPEQSPWAKKIIFTNMKTEHTKGNISEPDISVITLNGSEIKKLAAAHPNNLTFIKNEMKVVVPTAAINGLSLADTDEFMVIMDFDRSGTFFIRFYTGETELSGFDNYDFSVYVPYSIDEDNWTGYYCCSQINKKIPAKQYNGKNLCFVLNQTGNYTIGSSEAIRASAGLAFTAENEDLHVASSANDPENLPDRFISQIILLLTALFCALLIVYRKRNIGGLKNV